MARSKLIKRLNDSVTIWEPRTQDTRSTSNGPDLILLCAWMGASGRHVAKYTGGYQTAYPSARIVTVMTSMVNAAFTTRSANIKRVAPALDILCALPSDAKLIIHFFSNGGSFTGNLIAKQYLQRIGKPLPATAVILDSTPGRATYEATIRAFAVNTHSNIILRTVEMLLLRIFYALYRLLYLLSSSQDLVEQARQDLNDKSLMDVDTRRLYIYSEADEMVDWRFVEEHIEEAKDLGYSVESERYMASSHCGHLMNDPERYWGAVQRLWTSIPS